MRDSVRIFELIDTVRGSESNWETVRDIAGQWETVNDSKGHCKKVREKDKNWETLGGILRQ